MKTISEVLIDMLLEMTEEELREILGDEQFEEDVHRGREAIERALREFGYRTENNQDSV